MPIGQQFNCKFLSRIKLNNLSIGVNNLFIEVVSLIVAILIVLNWLGFSFFVKSELRLSMGVELAGHGFFIALAVVVIPGIPQSNTPQRQ